VLFIGADKGSEMLVKRPSLARYEKLLDDLARTEQGLQAGNGHPLPIGGYALAAVIEFLQADEVVASAGLTTSLSLILNALNDCRRGGRPAILFRQSKKAGRPTDQSFDAVKAAFTIAIDILVSAKVSRTEAGKYVATCARQLGLHQPNGSKITGEAALRWRDDIETSKSYIGTEVLKKVRGYYSTMQPIHDKQRARNLAKDILQQARHAGF
jgi:hypothetical protein